jgi:hypothetical protein
MVQCEGSEKPQSCFALITESVTERSAINIATAFTACEYSHSWRNALQLPGRVVQLAVA